MKTNIMINYRYYMANAISIPDLWWAKLYNLLSIRDITVEEFKTNFKRIYG